jgi:NAD-dependent dihydropyrimidine dehydrogenase PreA subunit
MDMDKTRTLPQVDEARCRLCGLCVEVCPCHAVEMGSRGPVFSCPEVCLSNGICADLSGCCLCEDACPAGAISWPFEIVFQPM